MPTDEEIEALKAALLEAVNSLEQSQRQQVHHDHLYQRLDIFAQWVEHELMGLQEDIALFCGDLKTALRRIQDRELPAGEEK